MFFFETSSSSSEYLLFICIVMGQAPPCFSQFLVSEPLADVHNVWAFISPAGGTLCYCCWSWKQGRLLT